MTTNACNAEPNAGDTIARPSNVSREPGQTDIVTNITAQVHSENAHDDDDDDDNDGCSCCSSARLDEAAGDVSRVARTDKTASGIDNADACSCCSDNVKDRNQGAPHEHDVEDGDNANNCSCCSSHFEVEPKEHSEHAGHHAEPADNCSCCSDKEKVAVQNTAIVTRPPPAAKVANPCECCAQSRRQNPPSGPNSTLQFIDESCCDAPCCKTFPRSRNRSFIRMPSLWPKKSTAMLCCGGHGTRQFQRLESPEPSEEEDTEKDLTLVIVGMDCPACTVRVERTLKNMGTKEVKVDFVGAFASCKYMTRDLNPETIRKKVQSATGFKCSVANRRDGKRTLRVHFEGSNRPSFSTLQQLLGVGQEILRLAKNEFRFVVSTKSAREIYSAILDQGWDAKIVNDDDEHTLTARANALDLKLSLVRFLASTALTVPVLVLSWSSGFEEHFTIRGGVSLGLTTLVVVGGAGKILYSAGQALFVDHELDADVLISLSTIAAYVYSIVSYAYNVASGTFTLDSYFETVTLLITLILFGRFISVYARTQASRTFGSIVDQRQIETATMAKDGTSIHTALLDAGDVIVVKQSEVIASDGIITSGRADIDESMLTGEAVPVVKGNGALVLAGTRVVLGEITVRLTKPTQDNSLAELHRLTNEARSSRAPVQDAADRVAKVIIPVVLVVAAACLLIWTLVYKLKEKRSSGASVADGLSYAVAVLALSCPCALTLCVPLVVLYAKSAAQKRGLLFKSSAALQIARKATHVIFDKTGTLTTGNLRVVEDFYADESLKPVISALVSGSEHPVSAAVARHLGTSTIQLSDIKSISGKGIQANFENRPVRGGNATWCAVQTHPVIVRMVAEGRSIFAVTVDDQLAAVFALEDDIRPETLPVLKTLLDAGKQVSILSGDHQRAVDRLLERLELSGNPSIVARGDCSPETKQSTVRIASWDATCEQPDDVEKGHVHDDTPKGNKPIVVFVGDGSNDTAALSQADVGISLAAGTSLALNSADVIILSGGLNGVLETLNMSKKSWRRIVVGLGWSLLYNTAAIVLGSGMLVKVRIEPQWAGLGELASLLPVILVAHSLRFFF